MKKIILAIDSFKGCLTSAEAEAACAEGIRSVCPHCSIICVPIADGGEGMLDALRGLGRKEVRMHVKGPLEEEVDARYLLSPDERTAYIEMASASGLTLVPPEKRNPMLTSTYGTGQLMRHAIGQGCRHLVIGLGGSATNDGGMGMLRALGYQLLDHEGKALEGCGEDLDKVCRIDDRFVLPALKDVRCTAACDVRNPFYGPQGAACVFAPQKGADSDKVGLLDKGLRNWAKVIAKATGRDIASLPGAGAAGGLGGALAAFLKAELRPGIDLLLEANHFAELIKDANWVITGEGKADRQTLMGKVPAGVLRTTRQAGIPTLLIAGQIENREELLNAGFYRLRAITPPDIPLQQAMRKEAAEANLRHTLAEILKEEINGIPDADKRPARICEPSATKDGQPQSG